MYGYVGLAAWCWLQFIDCGVRVSTGILVVKGLNLRKEGNVKCSYHVTCYITIQAIKKLLLLSLGRVKKKFKHIFIIKDFGEKNSAGNLKLKLCRTVVEIKVVCDFI